MPKKISFYHSGPDGKQLIWQCDIPDDVAECFTPGLIFIGLGAPMPPKFDEWQAEAEEWCNPHGKTKNS